MILTDVPAPHSFLIGFVMGFNQYVREKVDPELEYYEVLPEMERGWTWMPEETLSLPGSTNNSLLIATKQIILRCVGCKYSTTRKRYYHVGKSWAPGERLPSPDGNVRPRDNRWNDPVQYDHHIGEIHHYLIGQNVAKGSELTYRDLAMLESHMKVNGWPLNSTPRKKRVMKADPLMAILREGGLVA